MLPDLRIYTTQFDIKYLLFEQPEIISDVIKETGFWGKAFTDISLTILEKEKDGNVLDLGAGFGPFSIPLSLMTEGKFQFHAFEPLTVINMQLNTNVLLNNIDNIQTYKFALGDKNEFVEAPVLEINCNNHGAFSFNKKINELRGIRGSDDKETYEFRTVDSFNFKNVKLVKLSTPGTELNVLYGSAETLKNNDFPPVIFESWNNEWYKEEKAKVLDFFASRPYEHYLVLGEHMVAFKTLEQYNYYFNSSSVDANEKLTAVIENKQNVNHPTEFKVQEQLHDTSHVLKHQKPLL
jgi:FkbM family methyltransferase